MLKSIMKQAPPYTMYAENSEALKGNARFEGYSIDLIHHISEILGDNFK